MNWKDAPATECQLNHLRQLGCNPKPGLTKGEAIHLINRLESGFKPVAVSDPDAWVEQATRAKPKSEPHELRWEVERARRATVEALPAETKECEERLKRAVAERQDFWSDVFRGVCRIPGLSETVHSLYVHHGCQFLVPTRSQVQEILDALDSAMPYWDKDHQELFFKTLELNFPEVRRRVGA